MLAQLPPHGSRGANRRSKIGHNEVVYPRRWAGSATGDWGEYMAFLKRHWFAILTLAILTGYAGWTHFAALRETGPYTCQATETKTFHTRWIPFRIPQVSYLEVYIGGWIDAGSLTLESNMFAQRRSPENTNVIQFKSDPKNRTKMAAFSYFGEWYSPEFKLTFKPSPDARCRVKIAYRIFGIGEMATSVLSHAAGFSQ